MAAKLGPLALAWIPRFCRASCRRQSNIVEAMKPNRMRCEVLNPLHKRLHRSALCL